MTLRIRTVKPDLFRHEQLFDVEQKYKLPIRLAFIGLFCCCDREGRFRWRPRELKVCILPFDEGIDMENILNALLEGGFVRQYEYNDDKYGYIPTWHKHQRINSREAASTLPPPPAVYNVPTHISNALKTTMAS